jgi:hypothetical protein
MTCISGPLAGREWARKLNRSVEHVRCGGRHGTAHCGHGTMSRCRGIVEDRPTRPTRRCVCPCHRGGLEFLANTTCVCPCHRGGLKFLSNTTCVCPCHRGLEYRTVPCILRCTFLVPFCRPCTAFATLCHIIAPPTITRGTSLSMVALLSSRLCKCLRALIPVFLFYHVLDLPIMFRGANRPIF